jgi:mRNA-degrading endonuclease YafQ of YafQ-DinJ toxin-antitoxin module
LFLDNFTNFLFEIDRRSQLKKAKQADMNRNKKELPTKVIPWKFMVHEQFQEDLAFIQNNEPKFFSLVMTEIKTIKSSGRPPLSHAIQYFFQGKRQPIQDTHLISPSSDWIMLWFRDDIARVVVLYRVGRHARLELKTGKGS